MVERIENVEKIALTQTVQKGGCAAKIAATELRQILKQVTFPPAHPELLIDGGSMDDAAIYKVTDDIALVQTLDFFTPILDTPRLFGAVAATNALSDVYAMGGRPKTAMGILAFPLLQMSSQVIVDVMQGASDKIKEAGACFVGGHSIDDDTLKFGLSVTGFVDPRRVWSNAGARIGDHLILTKALGTGTMTAGLKRHELSETQIMEAIDSMMLLNNVVDFLSVELLQAVHAATDITGFALAGHSLQMALASGVSIDFETAAIPRFALTMDCLERGFLTKAHRSNFDYTETQSNLAQIPQLLRHLMTDPQTSGGMLLSVAPEHSQAIVHALSPQFPVTQIVGQILPKQELAVKFV